MHTQPFGLLGRLALGTACGAGATFLMQGMLQMSGKLMPDSVPPIKEDPGEFMLRKVKDALPSSTREQIPKSAEKAAAKMLHMGYGMTSGAIYGLLGPRRGTAAINGTLLGLGVWAAGYLGWLPATDLMSPITEHEPKQIAVPIVEHALFGIAVVAAYEAVASYARRAA
jgi:hypothetical protein